MQLTIARPNGQLGPFSLAEVNGHLASGMLVASDLAWWPGQSQWVPLSTVPGVQVPFGAQTFAPSPPSPTPTMASPVMTPMVSPGGANSSRTKKLTPGKVALYAVGGLIGLGVLGSILSPQSAQQNAPQSARSATADTSSVGARASAAGDKAKQGEQGLSEPKAQAERNAKSPEQSGAGQSGGQRESKTNGAPGQTSEQASRNVQVMNIKGVGQREVGVVDEVQYVIVESERASSLGNEITRTQADGTFLVLHMGAHNTAKETHNLNTSIMTLLDDKGRKFDPSHQGKAALALSGVKGADLGLTQIQPGTTKKMVLVFDIPSDATGLRLKIPGGFLSASGAATIKVP